MGVYLSKPITEKISSDHESGMVKCGASSMQGWRISQEDAHNCCLEFDEAISLFAVYDGHGGHEVAEYASKHLPRFIKETEAYKKGNYEDALKDAFLGFDASLITEPVKAELHGMANANQGKSSADDDDDEEEADDIEKLRKEANMPICEVIAQYAAAKSVAAQMLTGEGAKPSSPYLRARSSKAEGSLAGGDQSTSAGPSTSCSKDSKEPEVNGVEVVNGDLEKEGVSSSTDAKTPKKEEDTKTQNGEQEPNEVSESKASDSPDVGSSDGSSSKVKSSEVRAKRSNLSYLVQDSDSSSDENDESFKANINDSSDDDDDDGDDDGVEGAEEGADSEESEGEDDENDEEEESDEEDEDCNLDFADDGDKGRGLNVEEPGNDSGCTAVVALVVKNEVYVANAGDSRAVLCRNGTAIDLSIDHKPEDTPELERIIAAGGKVTTDGRVNGGLNLSRALGDHVYKKTASLGPTEQMITALPDIKKITINPETDEFMVLACDGIWNSLSSQEVVDFVRPLLKQGEKLSSICEKLFDECLAPDTMGDGTGCDNMTCVIVEFNKIQDDNAKRCASPLEDEPKRAKVEELEPTPSTETEST